MQDARQQSGIYLGLTHGKYRSRVAEKKKNNKQNESKPARAECGSKLKKQTTIKQTLCLSGL